ncbi:MAG: copper resistance protein CopC, partial [Anaerolineales bacterium]|nr:copper resistance protein CopC [Anaerolineales bacterium]
MSDRTRGRIRLSGLALALILALSLSPASSALAHALLLRSLPAADAELAQAPDVIELWFSEPLEPELSGARLLSSTGQEMAIGVALIDPADPTHLTVPIGALTPGIYTVAWHNASQTDGHPWQGSFPFTVLNPDGTRPAGGAGVTAAAGSELPGAEAVIGRWLGLLGSLALLGIPLFQRVVLDRGRTQSNEIGRLEAGATERALVGLWAAGLAVAAGYWMPTLLRVFQLDDAAHWPALIVGTRPAALALGRQALTGLGLLVALGLPQPPGLAERRRWLLLSVLAYLTGMVVLLGLAALHGEGWVLAGTLTAGGLGLALSQAGRGEHRKWEALVLLAAVALLSYSVSSHAAAVPGSLWAILGDYVHLLAAGAWAGGLLLLPGLMGRAQAPRAGRLGLVMPIVQRFSHLASFAVFVILLTGLFNSLVQ